MEEKYMLEALKQAYKAKKNGDVPVGAIIVCNGKIVAKAYNKKEKTKDVTNHAEMIAIKIACKKIKDWRLNNCKLFVTLEPCAMCEAAAEQARIEKIIYGTENNNNDRERLNPIILKEKSAFYNKECELLLKKFFKERR